MEYNVLVLGDSTRAWLLYVAHEALARALHTEPRAVAPVRPDDPELDRHAAAFVSWHEGAKLAGCVGTLQARTPLEACVREYAVQAGLHDPRMPPATSDRLDRLSCEISILGEPSPLPVTGTEAIAAALRPGRDGLILRDGLHRAVFLPVVWNQLPDREAFIGALCRKAGIDRELRGAFVTGETFETETFGDV